MGNIWDTVLMYGKWETFGTLFYCMGNIFEHLGHCFNAHETFGTLLMYGKHLGHCFNVWESFGTLF